MSVFLWGSEIRRAESEVLRLQTMLDHFGDLAKQDHDDLQAKIGRLKETLRAILNSDMAQAAEDEGRVVPELEAARRVLDEARGAESGVPDFGAVLRAAREKRKFPPMCVECGRYASDPPSRLCPGCEAYKEHTA